MKLKKTQTVLEYKLVSRFDQLRDRLLEDRQNPRLERPLAYWALSNDRRLPLAFMGRQLRDLLETPFDQLCTTPGVGEKKLDSLLNLLERAVRDRNIPEPVVEEEPQSEALLPGQEQFDADAVSESTWGQWQATVRRNGLLQEPLGRFVSSLSELPRVLWMTPLAAYADSSLAEIRERKAHGEKRVHAIIEVFGSLQGLLSQEGCNCHLAVQILPRRILDLNHWVCGILAAGSSVSPEDIQHYFIEPLLEQIRCDAGEVVIDLVAERLMAAREEEASVRKSAARLELTRARVYQLLGDAGAIMQVRWPQGQFYLDRLAEQFPDGSYRPFHAALELFYPSRRTEPTGDGFSSTLRSRRAS